MKNRLRGVFEGLVRSLRRDLAGVAAPERPVGAQVPGQFLAGRHVAAAGERPYRLFVPGRLALPARLVVMLHGCTQSPEDFAAGTRMNELAERHGFLVLYPGQIARANGQRCWNWFKPEDQQRDAGEPAILASMARGVMAQYGVAPQSVFAAGLSAGGAEAAILGARYPEIFGAIGVHSGLACGAAHNMQSAFAAMQQGAQGVGVFGVRAIIFHGDQDRTVRVSNALAVARQFGAVGDGVVTQGEVGSVYTRTVFGTQVEMWVVQGGGHAWFGGSEAGKFTQAGPDASAEMVRFFGI